ncbi:muconolactone Delta-isomerase [Amycolatopsis jejuensis]|uniref:muconolactone Delta-isomerase n=1 Tax=Amycolatopsis jejuensis TaxID=330084 RepID=UPI000524A60C|nr:muconolactone Delta-isomerase family protein [Amycolatopsis jejuensis]
MIFHVQMDVALPAGLDPQRRDELLAAEKKLALQLQHDGIWLHLWRVAGKRSNISIFEVPDADALHGILSSLPLFPFMQIEVTALAQHPSSVEAQS